MTTRYAVGIPCWVMRTRRPIFFQFTENLAGVPFRLVTIWVFIEVILKYHSVVGKPKL